MQTALRFLNRYAGLQVIQRIFKTKITEEVVEGAFFHSISIGKCIYTFVPNILLVEV